MNRWGVRHWCLLAGITVFLFFVSFFIGRYSIAPGEAASTLFFGIVRQAAGWWAALASWASGSLHAANAAAGGHHLADLNHTVIFQIRLPRIVAAALVGGGLSIAGTSFQGLFKNPLVSPDLLGVASGAGFGAALGILFSGNPVVIQASAFLFGIVAVAVTYGISKVYRSPTILVLVLSGIIIGALFSALLSFLKYVADPYDTLPAIVFWLMGSLASVKSKELIMVGPPMILAGAVLFVVRWRINLLAMGDDEARSLGVNIKRMTNIIVICSTIITASAVCISGIVGWVGLVVPHIGRLLVGPDFRKLVPASVLIGSSFLMVVDNVSRTAFPIEIPLGILTAIIGTPVFAYLLTRKKVGWL
jgi:iron complex transport system permease protein